MLVFLQRKLLLGVLAAAIAFVAAAAVAVASPTDSEHATAVRVVAKTSPVSPGEYATVQVRVSSAGVVCRIGVFYKTTKSEAKGLGPKRPRDGLVTWRWKVGSNTTPGRWRVEIDCGDAGKTKTTMRVR